jgi:hypothetical protein
MPCTPIPFRMNFLTEGDSGVPMDAPTPAKHAQTAMKHYTLALQKLRAIDAIIEDMEYEAGEKVTIDALMDLKCPPLGIYLNFALIDIPNIDSGGVPVEYASRNEYATSTLLRLFYTAQTASQMLETHEKQIATAGLNPGQNFTQAIRASTNQVSDNVIEKWKGEADQRTAKEYFRDCESFMGTERQLDTSIEENRRELLNVIKNRMAAGKARDTFNQEWRMWRETEKTVANPNPWPKNETVLGWLDALLTVRRTVEQTYTTFTETAQEMPGLKGYNGYRLQFMLAKNDCESAGLKLSMVGSFPDKMLIMQFKKGLHHSVTKILGHLGKIDDLPEMTLEEYITKISQKALLKLRDGAIPHENPYVRKRTYTSSGKQSWARTQKVFAARTEAAQDESEWSEDPENETEEQWDAEDQWQDEDEDEEEEYATIAYGKGGSYKGSKGGKGFKGKGKGGKGSKGGKKGGKGGKGKGGKRPDEHKPRPRCPVCKNPHHSNETSCFWSEKYEDYNGKWKRPSWITEKMKDKDEFRTALEAKIKENVNLPSYFPKE